MSVTLFVSSSSGLCRIRARQPDQHGRRQGRLFVRHHHLRHRDDLDRLVPDSPHSQRLRSHLRGRVRCRNYNSGNPSKQSLFETCLNGRI